MFKHECYKIFSRKSIYIAFALLLLLAFLPELERSGERLEETAVYQEIYRSLGGPVTEEKYAEASEKRQELEEVINQEVEDQIASADEDFTGPFLASDDYRAADAAYSSVIGAYNSLYSFEERKSEIQKVMEESDAGSFAYKTAAKELGMLEEMGQPFGFYNTSIWAPTADFVNTYGFIILSAMILLGLSPVFADEHARKTAGLILSTKHGKKKIVTAKLMASLTFITGVFVIAHLVNLLRALWSGPLADGNTAIQNIFLFFRSPYSWDLWQYFLITLSVQFIAAIAVGVLVLFLSVVLKNSLLAFFVSGAVFGTPFLVRQFGYGLSNEYILYFINFSYAELLRVKGLFDHFNAYNVFGTPVLHGPLVIFVYLALTVVLLLLTYNRFRHQQINY